MENFNLSIELARQRQDELRTFARPTGAARTGGKSNRAGPRQMSWLRNLTGLTIPLEPPAHLLHQSGSAI